MNFDLNEFCYENYYYKLFSKSLTFVDVRNLNYSFLGFLLTGLMKLTVYVCESCT